MGKDATSVTNSVMIEKPLSVVWEIVTKMENMPQWARGVKRIISVEPPGEIKLGSTVVDIGLGLKKRWPETFLVDIYEPFKKVGFKWEGSYGTAYVRYEFEDIGGDKTKFNGETYGKYTFPFSLILQFMRKTANNNFKATMENIKRICNGERGFKK
jgi:uncharacterized membrane protein